MNRRSHSLLGLWLSLGLAFAPGLALAADPKLEELKTAISDATDERGVPTPEQFDLRVELVRLLLASAQENDAASQLRIAAELGPLEQDLAFLLAEYEVRDGRKAAAARQYRSISERFESSSAEVHLAGLALERGRDKQALGHAQRAVRFAETAEMTDDADLQRALDLHWKVAERVGAHAEAMASLQRLSELAPDEFRYPWHLGEILVAQGRHAEAVEFMKVAHGLADGADSDDSDDRDAPAELDRSLGLALVAEDRFDEARTYLASYLATRPDTQAAAYLDADAALALVEERLGEAEAAQARARRVLDAVPEHAGALLVMGRLHAASGDFEAARQALEASLASDPESAKTHYQLSLACARLRDRECAERHLARYQVLQEPPEDVVEMTRLEPTQGDGDGR